MDVSKDLTTQTVFIYTGWRVYTDYQPATSVWKSSRSPSKNQCFENLGENYYSMAVYKLRFRTIRQKLSNAAKTDRDRLYLPTTGKIALRGSDGKMTWTCFMNYLTITYAGIAWLKGFPCTDRSTRNVVSCLRRGMWSVVSEQSLLSLENHIRLYPITK